jgi:hypothetical protein
MPVPSAEASGQDAISSVKFFFPNEFVYNLKFHHGSVVYIRMRVT